MIEPLLIQNMFRHYYDRVDEEIYYMVTRIFAYYLLFHPGDVLANIAEAHGNRVFADIKRAIITKQMPFYVLSMRNLFEVYDNEVKIVLPIWPPFYLPPAEFAMAVNDDSKQSKRDFI